MQLNQSIKRVQDVTSSFSQKHAKFGFQKSRSGIKTSQPISNTSRISKCMYHKISTTYLRSQNT